MIRHIPHRSSIFEILKNLFVYQVFVDLYTMDNVLTRADVLISWLNITLTGGILNINDNLFSIHVFMDHCKGVYEHLSEMLKQLEIQFTFFGSDFYNRNIHIYYKCRHCQSWNFKLDWLKTNSNVNPVLVDSDEL